METELPYHLKIHHGPQGLAQASADWDAVIAAMAQPHFFQMRQWYESYLDALEAHPEDLLLCIIYDGATPVAVLPLKREVRTIAGIRLRTLELPRHDHMHLRDITMRDDYRDKLSLSAIVQLIRGSHELRWDVLALWHVLDDSCTMAAHRLAAPGRCIGQVRFTCSHMPLAPWETLSKSLSKNFRRNLKNANNRAREIAGLRYERAATLEDLERVLPEFINIEASGWKGHAGTGTAIKVDPGLVKFYQSVTRRFGQHGGCEIHLLRDGDKPIAATYILLTERTGYGLKAAYDEEYGRISPVHLLLEKIFTDLGQRPNLRDFNITSEATWFDVYKPLRSDVHNIYLFNNTMKGLGAYTAMALAQRWRERKAGRSTMPPELNHAA